VIGAGAAQLAESMIDDWLERTGPRSSSQSRRPRRASSVSSGSAMRYSRVQPARWPHALGDLSAKVRSPEARLNLLRLTYLLVQTDLARLS